jgi:diguanylate cyclase (GGDEF)-like protein
MVSGRVSQGGWSLARMVRRRTVPGLRTVVDDSFRLVIAGAGFVVLLTVCLFAWLMLVSRPAVSRAEDGLVALQANHSGALDQALAVRGFLASGDPEFLGPYEHGGKVLAAAEADLVPLAAEPALTQGVLDVYLTQRRWAYSWAEPALRDYRSYPPGTTKQVEFLLTGKALFDQYRAAQAALSQRTTAVLDERRRAQNAALLGASGGATLTGLLILAAAANRRRALRRDVLDPVGVLTTALDSVRQGELEQKVMPSGASELREVAQGFNTMTASLVQARRVAADREQHIHEQAARLRTILRMVKEIGGSLNLTYVLQSVVDGVKTVTGADRVVVWLLQEHEASLLPVRDSDFTPRIMTPGSGPGEGPADAAAAAADSRGPVEVGTGVVGRAAKYGRTTVGNERDGDGAGHLAVPLIIGARVVGVLELVRTDLHQLSDDQIEVLETLSIHAGAAIEAARLHQTTSHASEHDALTRLANRRRLESDLTLECDRSLRYGGPVSLLMLDLDHFKRLNDTYGHSRGDEVLQGVADTITGTLRSTDTAYRYGGEELVILARETPLTGALELAERIRGAIERRYAGPGETGVTASIGVAALPDDAASPNALVKAADRALYTAKNDGRNQVCMAAAPTLADEFDATPATPAIPR